MSNPKCDKSCKTSTNSSTSLRRRVLNSQWFISNESTSDKNSPSSRTSSINRFRIKTSFENRNFNQQVQIDNRTTHKSFFFVSNKIVSKQNSENSLSKTEPFKFLGAEIYNNTNERKGHIKCNSQNLRKSHFKIKSMTPKQRNVKGKTFRALHLQTLCNNVSPTNSNLHRTVKGLNSEKMLQNRNLELPSPSIRGRDSSSDNDFILSPLMNTGNYCGSEIPSPVKS